MSKVLGIDLGTTNSCVSVFDGGEPVVVSNKNGYKTTPSIVAVTGSGKRIVGEIAKRQAVTNAQNTVFGAKRLIGKPWNSPAVIHAIESMPFDIVKGSAGDARVVLASKEYSIQEISAFILQELKRVADIHVGAPVNKAVVTVPAYFSNKQRQATKEAGRIAGLEVIRIINEPTAAALSYGFDRKDVKKVAVYDLGGGTFDISIMNIQDGVFEVLGTAGDTFLGGEDFDERIIDWLVFGFVKAQGVDLKKDKMAFQRLKDVAEKAKRELSSATETQITLPFIYTTESGETLNLERTFSREKLDILTVDLVERTIVLCEKTLDDARLNVSDIDEVILVGGQTRMPLVQSKVEEFFGRAPFQGIHPDEAVAMGAAIQGAALCDPAHNILLLDVTPHSLGLAVVGNKFHVLIEKNTTVPTSETHLFTTNKDDQSRIKVIVLQGESDTASDNELLGEFLLSGLRQAPKGEVTIEIAFSISSDGIVSVSAVDTDTGLSQNIQLAASSGLSEQEISSLITANNDHLVQLKDYEDIEKLRQSVSRLSSEIKKLFPLVQGAVSESEYGTAAIEKVFNVTDVAEIAFENGDRDQLVEVQRSLQRAVKMFKGVLLRES